jgi:hypothetical protein
VTTHQDAPAASGRRAVVHGREDAVVARLQALGTALDGEPDPDFRAATRARLVAMAAVRSPAPAPPSRMQRLFAARDAGPAAHWRNRVTAGLAAAALTVTALATLVAVSANARPGDALYGLKRGTEQTQLALTGDSRGQTLLDFATTRLSELDALVGHGGSPNQELVLSTLRTMNSETTEGSAWLTGHAVDTRSTAPVDTLETWTSGQSAGLSALIPSLPTGAQPAAGQALDLLRRVDVRAGALGTALGCPGGPATRGTDQLGPVPGQCSSTGTSSRPGAGTTSGSLLPTNAQQQGTLPSGQAPPGSAGVDSPAPGGVTLPTGGVAVPSAGSPAPSTPPVAGVPTPSITVTVPLPIPLPGASAGSAGSTSPGTLQPPAGLSICLSPLLPGSC